MKGRKPIESQRAGRHPWAAWLALTALSIVVVKQAMPMLPVGIRYLKMERM